MTPPANLQDTSVRWILAETASLTLVAVLLVRLQMAIGGWTALLAPAVWIYIPLALILAGNHRMRRYGFALSAWRAGWVWLLASVLLVLAPFALLSSICCGIVDPAADYSLRSIIGRLSAADPLYQLAAVAVPEELFFRGYVQARFADLPVASDNPAIPILLGAFFFALAHMLVEPGVIRAAVFFPGLIMGLLRHRSGGLAAPAGFHWLANLLPAALAFRV